MDYLMTDPCLLECLLWKCLEFHSFVHVDHIKIFVLTEKLQLL